MSGGGQVMQALAAQTPQVGPGLLGDITDWLDAQKQSVQAAAQAAKQRQGLLGSVIPEVRQSGWNAVMNSPAAQMAMGLAPFGVTVYHGSPHTFDAFDISKVGTGEGAQAYGHGMYFAENPATADYYRKALSVNADVGGKPLIRNGELVGTTGNKLVDNTLYPYALWGMPVEEAAKAASASGDEATAAALRKVAPDFKLTSGGNLYKADIPDALIPKMLDWDKPLSQQPQAVQKLMRPYGEIATEATRNYKDWGDVTAGDAYKYMAGTISQQNASQALRDIGVPGIRYLDAGSRAGGEGTYNYVLFDPSVAKILSRE